MPNVGLENGVLTLPEQAAPTGEAGVGKLYVKTTKQVALVDADGVELILGASPIMVAVSNDEQSVIEVDISFTRVTVDV